MTMTSLAVVKTSPSNEGGAGSIPGRGAKIPHTSWAKNQNIKQKNDQQQLRGFKKTRSLGKHHGSEYRSGVLLLVTHLLFAWLPLPFPASV